MMRKKMKCQNCEKGDLIEVNDIASELDGYVFIAKGKRCGNCNEEFIDEKEGEKIIQLAKRFWSLGKFSQTSQKIKQKRKRNCFKNS